MYLYLFIKHMTGTSQQKLNRGQPKKLHGAHFLAGGDLTQALHKSQAVWVNKK